MQRLKKYQNVVMPILYFVSLLSFTDAFVAVKQPLRRNRIVHGALSTPPSTKKETTSTGWDLATSSPYVPSGLTHSEYQTIKKHEDEKIKSMNFGHFGPRFHIEDEIPEGDWMLLPDLWKSGKASPSTNAAASSHSMPIEEQALLLLEHATNTAVNTQSTSSSSNIDETACKDIATKNRPLRILAPVIQEDPFLQRAWENGHHVTMLGLVPSAAMAMRSYFGRGSPKEWIEKQLPLTPKEEGTELNNRNRNNNRRSAMIWQHTSGRANIIIGCGFDHVETLSLSDGYDDADIENELDTEDKEDWTQGMLQPRVLNALYGDGDNESMSDLFDVVYDHTAIEALDPPERRQFFLDELLQNLKDDGYFFTETALERIQNSSDSLLNSAADSATCERSFMIAERILCPEASDNGEGDLAEEPLLDLESVKGREGGEEWVLKQFHSSLEDSFVPVTMMEGMKVHNVNGINLVDIDDAEYVRRIVLKAEESEGLTVLGEIPQSMFGVHTREDPQEVESKKEKSTSRTVLVEIEKESVSQKLGIRLNDDHGMFTVREISHDSIFKDSSLKVGMPIEAINGISVKGRDMAFCREILSYSLHVILEVVTDESTNSEATLLEGEEKVESKILVEDSSPSQASSKKELHENNPDSIIFGHNFEHVSSLGSVDADAFVDIGHLLRVMRD